MYMYIITDGACGGPLGRRPPASTSCDLHLPGDAARRALVEKIAGNSEGLTIGNGEVPLFALLDAELGPAFDLSALREKLAGQVSREHLGSR